MVQLTRFNSYSLRQLKEYCVTHNIVFIGDRRKKATFIESIAHHELHNSQPEPTTVEFTYDAEADTTSEITGDSDTWLSDAYNSEPTEEELLIYKATQAPNVIEDIWLEPEEPAEAPPIEPGIPTIILPLLIPFLLIGLVVIGIGKLATALLGWLISSHKPPTVKAPAINKFTRTYWKCQFDKMVNVYSMSR